MQGQKILLCIDNLETVLRDHYKNFIDFYESLPAKWRIIVTSRIPLDAAKTIAIDVLDSNGAIAMARNYLASKGSEKSKNQDFVEKIALGAKKNPLAIRLTIDLYLAGKDISDALAKGDQDVLTFSFTSLVETLIDNEIKILESLFVLEDPTKSDICNILKLSHDEVSLAISRLSSMSLIIRDNDDDNYETYSLASSIRDLLRVHPKKPEIRQQVVSQISKEKSSALILKKQLSDRNVKPISLEFAPDYAERKYLTLLQQVSSAVKNNYRQALPQLIQACQRKIDLDKNSAILYRIYAHALLGLEDYVEAINFFNKAYSLEPTDHAIKYGLQIAQTSLRDHESAFDTGVFLINNGWGEPEASGSFIANRIWNWTLRSSNFKDDLSYTFDKTANWNERSHELPALGLSRCSAFRRLLDIEKKNGNLSFQREIEVYSKAANIMTIIPIQNDYPKWMTAEIGRLANEIKSFLIENESLLIDDNNKNEINTILLFYKSILINSIKLQLNGFSNEIITFCKEIIGDEANEETTSKRLDQYRSNGFTIARIKTREINIGKPIFAKDENNDEYYISKDLIPKKFYKDKKRLYGNIVAIKHQPNSNKNKASTVIEINFL
jgi:DNA-binding MarR family transcriptional regulator